MINRDDIQDSIMVSVFMITYLHAKYIKQAINGVLIQECDFPIELIIADDKSPDNTEEVVTEFLKNHPKRHLVKYTRHKENKGMHGNFQWLTAQARGKYIAICEGDDYWTDPYKLHKQVSFLEENPDYGMVYTKSKVFVEKTQIFLKPTVGSIIDKRGILYVNSIPNVTTLYRADLDQLYLESRNINQENWSMGDYPRWIWYNYNSKIHFINEVTTVYRKLENSASNYVDIKKQMAFKKDTMKIQLYYGKKYLNDSEFLKLKNHLFHGYYYLALSLDSADSIVYYNEIKETIGLKPIVKTKLFVLEKLKFKHLFLIWFKSKQILKTFLFKEREKTKFT